MYVVSPFVRMSVVTSARAYVNLSKTWHLLRTEVRTYVCANVRNCPALVPPRVASREKDQGGGGRWAEAGGKRGRPPEVEAEWCEGC